MLMVEVDLEVHQPEDVEHCVSLMVMYAVVTVHTQQDLVDVTQDMLEMTANIDVIQLLLVQVMAHARYGEHVFVTILTLVTAVTANVMITQLVLDMESVLPLERVFVMLVSMEMTAHCHVMVKVSVLEDNVNVMVAIWENFVNQNVMNMVPVI